MSRPLPMPCPLKAWRKKHRITQAKLSALTGYRQSYICLVETRGTLVTKERFAPFASVTKEEVTFGMMMAWYYEITIEDVTRVNQGNPFI